MVHAEEVQPGGAQVVAVDFVHGGFGAELVGGYYASFRGGGSDRTNVGNATSLSA